MTRTTFEWDDRKNHLNWRKHGVWFEEAKSVFFDDRAREFFDDEHSQREERFLMLGLSNKLRMLMVCYCVENDGAAIRIISARRATKNEQSFYPEGKRR